MDRVFPAAEWARLAPEAAGFSAKRLASAEQWLHDFAGDQPFRLVIARYGYLVAEWIQGMDPEARIRFHSASKSVYSSLLGIAVAEGRLPSIDSEALYRSLSAEGNPTLETLIKVLRALGLRMSIAVESVAAREPETTP